MKASRTLAALVAVALLALPAAAATPRGLAFVPADAATVGVVDLAAMRENPLSSRFFLEADRMTIDHDGDELLRQAGLDPVRDVDTVVFAGRPGVGADGENQALVIAEGRFDAARIGSVLVSRGADVSSSNAGTWYLMKSEGSDDRVAVAFAASGLAFLGSEEAVLAALESTRNGGTGFLKRGALAPEVASIDPDATAWVAVDVARSSRLSGAPSMPGSSPAHGHLDNAARSVSYLSMWISSGAESLRFGAGALSRDDESAKLLEDLLRGMLATWRLAAQERAPELLPALRDVKVSQRDRRLQVAGAIPGDILRSLAAKHRVR